MYIVTKDYLKYCCFIQQRILNNMYQGLCQIVSSTTVFNIDSDMKCKKSAY